MHAIRYAGYAADLGIAFEGLTPDFFLHTLHALPKEEQKQ